MLQWGYHKHTHGIELTSRKVGEVNTILVEVELDECKDTRRSLVDIVVKAEPGKSVTRDISKEQRNTGTETATRDRVGEKVVFQRSKRRKLTQLQQEIIQVYQQHFMLPLNQMDQ